MVNASLLEEMVTIFIGGLEQQIEAKIRTLVRQSISNLDRFTDQTENTEPQSTSVRSAILAAEAATHWMVVDWNRTLGRCHPCGRDPSLPFGAWGRKALEDSLVPESTGNPTRHLSRAEAFCPRDESEKYFGFYLKRHLLLGGMERREKM